MADKPGTSESSKAVRRRPPPGKPFAKGKSGNPGGRPKGYAEFRDECQKMTPGVLKRLRDVALGQSGLAVEAAKTILAYAWGKPTAVVDLNAKVTGDIAAILDEARVRAGLKKPE